MATASEAQIPEGRAWVTQVPDAQLKDLHFGLRLVTNHPGLSGDEREALKRLADACWDEHARRCSEKCFRGVGSPSGSNPVRIANLEEAAKVRADLELYGAAFVDEHGYRQHPQRVIISPDGTSALDDGLRVYRPQPLNLRSEDA
jgi:hypothetical protein